MHLTVRPIFHVRHRFSMLLLTHIMWLSSLVSHTFCGPRSSALGKGMVSALWNAAGGKAEEEGSHSKRQGPLTREEKMMHAWLKYYKSVANKEKAQLAKALHRANLLCLLAHGILLDQAANEPLVQASLLPIRGPIGVYRSGVILSWVRKC
jgi:hypothetical protein